MGRSAGGHCRPERTGSALDDLDYIPLSWLSQADYCLRRAALLLNERIWVKKLCERYGLRVQNSVFEVLVDAAQLAKLKSDLASAIDFDQDSVRFYRLGNSYQNRIDTMGRTGIIQTGEPLLL